VTEIVAIDIGGTHARFALAEVHGGRVTSLGKELVLKTADYTSLGSAWEAASEVLGQQLPAAAAIAVAAPIFGEAIRFTNNPWIIDPAHIGRELGLRSHLLLNDFVAVAHAVAQVGDGHFAHICGPDVPLPAAGSICVVGPGTGLGVAQLYREGSAYRVLPSEGGHIGFAPADSVDDALLERLRARFGRVSAERVVSGPGLAAIYRTLGELQGRTVDEFPDADLWSLALSGEDQLASAALDRFCMTLGSAVGDLALAHGAVAVVIAGGLGGRLREHLRRTGFTTRFHDKGRFAAMTRFIPVKLLEHPQPGLFGAAAAFATNEAAGR
jgi:glucokinase